MTEPESAFSSGEHIGAYEVRGLLGRGGMGEVFLAWDPALKRPVAIKRIRQDSGMTPTLRQRLLREAQAVVNLDHPAIVRVHHLQEHDGDDCIVMEYVQGKTLAEALRDGPLEQAFAVRLAKEIASGLAAAHEAGIIHRDLKAENVMITPSKAVKILDFGLAKPLRTVEDDPSLTEVGCVVGTRRTMSPEQRRGDEVDGRSDLFSLGVLLYEMLTGSSPFQGTNPQAILCNMFQSGAPPHLVSLLEQLLAQEPAARPQSAAEVVRELEAVEASLGSTANLPGEETVSGLPTEVSMPKGGGFHPPAVPPAAAAAAREPWHRLEIAVSLSLSIVILLAASLILTSWWRARPPKTPRPVVPDHPLSQQAPAENDPPLAPSPAALKVSEKDRAIFKEIKDRVEAAEAPLESERQLDDLIQKYPDYIDARILAIDIDLTLYQSTQISAYLSGAKALLDGDPDNPKLMPYQIKYDLAAGHKDEAKADLKQLTDLNDDNQFNLEISELSTQLAEGNVDKAALTSWKRAVERSPSWQNRLELARFEQNIDGPSRTEAGKILRNLKGENPGNIYVLQALAEYELYYGEPKSAKSIYQDLTEKLKPFGWNNFARFYYINLGTACFFLDDFKGAAKAFQEALNHDKYDIEAKLNLADVEKAQQQPEADGLYQEVLDGLELKYPEGKGMPAENRMMKAQCLANLNKTRDAMDLAADTVNQNPNDATLLQSAALVFALANDGGTLGYIHDALEKGIQPRWFRLQPYGWLAKNPKYAQEYQQLVYESGPAGGHISEQQTAKKGGPVGAAREGSSAVH